MSRHFLFASLLIAVSTTALANDLKPGEWEVTQSMAGEQLPEQMTQERVETQCMTAEESHDMAATMRKEWKESGCEDIHISRNGDIINAQASCPTGALTTTFDAEIRLHSDAHFVTEIDTDNGQHQQVTIHQEGHWVGESCEAG